MTPKGPPKGAQKVTQISLSGALGHSCPQMTPTAPPLTSKSYQNYPKTTQNQPDFDEYFGRVQILALTPKSQQTNCGHSVLHFIYFLNLEFRQSIAAIFNSENSKRNGPGAALCFVYLLG